MKKILMMTAFVLGGFVAVQAQEAKQSSKVAAKKVEQVATKTEVKKSDVVAEEAVNLGAPKSDAEAKTLKAAKTEEVTYKEVGIESLPKAILTDITNKYDGAKISSVKTDGRGNYELQIEDASQDGGMQTISVMDSAHKQ